MKFCFISLLIVVSLWTVGFYPVDIYLGQEHLHCFFICGVIVLSSSILSYALFHWGYGSNSSDYLIQATLAGTLIRMTVVLIALAIASRSEINIKIFTLWMLGFYFFFLFYETFYLMREQSS